MLLTVFVRVVPGGLNTIFFGGVVVHVGVWGWVYVCVSGSGCMLVIMVFRLILFMLCFHVLYKRFFQYITSNILSVQFHAALMRLAVI